MKNKFVHYNKHKDLEDYYQEQLLIFHPLWTQKILN
jgi:hypothetical protein